MSSFLINTDKILSKIESDINLINDITDENLLIEICKFFLYKEDKEPVLFLIKNNKMPRLMSSKLFQFIINNNFLDLLFELDYNKFDIHTKDDFILRKISSEGRIDIVKFLVENGANIHAMNDSALKISSSYGHIEVVKFLVENGANIHADNNHALKHSCARGHLKIVKYLVENGASIHTNDDYVVIISSGFGHIEIVKFLIEKGANIRANNDQALRLSSKNGHIEVVKFLIKKELDIHADDDYAIRLSSFFGNIDVVKFLVENGANIHAKDDYTLRMSSVSCHIDIVKFLIYSDIEYFKNNKITIPIIQKHNLNEFCKILGINEISATKNDILSHIENQNIGFFKQWIHFDFSSDEYFCFFKALDTNNIELIQLIFDKIQNKDELLCVYNKKYSFFNEDAKNIFDKMYENDIYDIKFITELLY